MDPGQLIILNEFKIPKFPPVIRTHTKKEKKTVFGQKRSLLKTMITR